MVDVSEALEKIFNDDPSVQKDDTLSALLDNQWGKTKTARDDAQRLIDWYNRDRTKIVGYLYTIAQKTFGDDEDSKEELAKWQFPIINGVQRTVKRISMAYRQEPVREYFKGEAKDPLKPGAAELDAIESMYEGLNLDKKMKEVDRWATLLNTVHFEAVYRDGAIDWDVRLKPGVIIGQDPTNYLDFVWFAYRWAPMDPNTLVEYPGWVYWSKDRHIFITEKGHWIGLSTDDGKNPFEDGFIPIVTVRKTEPVGSDYWGRYGADMVDAFESANLQLASFWENLFLQTFGQPVGTNLKLSKKTIKVGPRHPILVDKVTKDDVPPSLDFAKPDADIKEVQGAIDWYIKAAAAGSYGLPPSAWSQEETRLSGFAKFLDNIELLENRDDEIEVYRTIEEDAFEASVTVWNHNDGAIADTIYVVATFPSITFPQSPLEEIEIWGAKINFGFADVVDYFMEKDGLSEEKAIAKAKKLQDRKKQFAPPPPQLPPGVEPDEDEDEDEEVDENEGE
jgi:hypothetical protein